MPFPIRIAITGPESSGKSVLAKLLTQNFSPANWVPEFARTYLTALPPSQAYTFSDLPLIANAQQILENEIAKTPNIKWLFADTEALVVKIWAQIRFGQQHPTIETIWQQQAQQYALYLLTAPDLPWQPDPLRETPLSQTRWQLFDLYKTYLTQTNRRFTIIQGEPSQRLNIAKTAIKQLLTV
ncbi:MAG: AAA family ATPase [Sphingobacteriales bacterium]|jgi:NadR type nicotinamide-nucleotide adenylyltransferase|nr:AAA family ATPase [Sphingobacteriales bacterium]MBK6889305.1 AAA family ATPase [Sphingobacteriales bacterium]MBK7528198.1 AAA family ATPase [Sphingobacteriales bacterium]MBL0246075.1 AAA family ATPase [Sphingobacteriales bacterium]MDA0199732.1 AAA family ATPase [Bacteroidota bacterium]